MRQTQITHTCTHNKYTSLLEEAVLQVHEPLLGGLPGGPEVLHEICGIGVRVCIQVWVVLHEPIVEDTLVRVEGQGELAVDDLQLPLGGLLPGLQELVVHVGPPQAGLLPEEGVHQGLGVQGGCTCSSHGTKRPTKDWLVPRGTSLGVKGHPQCCTCAHVNIDNCNMPIPAPTITSCKQDH